MPHTRAWYCIHVHPVSTSTARTGTSWEPPSEVSHADVVARSAEVLGRRNLAIRVREDVFRVDAAEFDWDVGGKVFEPVDPAAVPVGADGRKAGILLLHGGAGDHRALEPMAEVLATKFGFKVVTVAYPGQFYLPDLSRRWPGDTLHGGGMARTPIWTTEERVTPDEYELVEESSDAALRARHGTMFFARAKEGSDFYHRLAACPLAYERAYAQVCARNFPPEEYSVYLHGHSTGGPQMHMMLQRVPNVVGLVGIESSPYGHYFGRMLGFTWRFPFNYMTVRTWRDIARYKGNEVDADAVRSLPWLMEEVLEDWERRRDLPNMKFQDLVQFAAYDALEAAARVTAGRLRLSDDDTRALVGRYRGYPRPLEGPDVKPVPPLLYGVTVGSMDHRPERYRDILLPALAEIAPAPKARLVVWQAGVHRYLKPEDDLPLGVGPAVAALWHEAIVSGYYS